MPPMSIELTPKQQNALDHQAGSPLRVVDPRARTAYVLVPESEYDAMRELLEDERREETLHSVALRNAGHRLR
jgi:PHD/YefM family antitoxin component YafN of YafNO toxin-antitoxin module